jgi:hypothetical protein
MPETVGNSSTVGKPARAWMPAKAGMPATSATQGTLYSDPTARKRWHWGTDTKHGGRPTTAGTLVIAGIDTKHGGGPITAGTSVIGYRYKAWWEAIYSRDVSNRVYVQIMEGSQL